MVNLVVLAGSLINQPSTQPQSQERPAAPSAFGRDANPSILKAMRAKLN
jgi:hypothetical protein